MAYQYFTENKPVISDSGTVVIDTTRYNLEAVRDGLLLGDMYGWTYTTNGSTLEQPPEVRYIKGTDVLRGLITWGTAGNEKGNVKSVVWALSVNSGSSFTESIGTLNFTYSGAGTLESPGVLTQSTWA